MACFLAPTAEAVVTTIVTKVIKSRENKLELGQCLAEDKSDALAVKIPFSRKLKWLSHLLWGGSALLAFEHIWHGELQPFFPFLTAASNPEDAGLMLQELSTAGVAMAGAVTVVWFGMLAASSIIEKRALKQQLLQEQGRISL